MPSMRQIASVPPTVVAPSAPWTMHGARSRAPTLRAAGPAAANRSSTGRLIPASLAFGTAEGGNFTPAGAARGQQLYLRSRLKNAPALRHPLVITREIEGQHFVQKGGEAGFRQYRTSVLAAARQAFAGQRFSP